MRKLKAHGTVQVVLGLIICTKRARLEHSLLGFGCRWVNTRPIIKWLSTAFNTCQSPAPGTDSTYVPIMGSIGLGTEAAGTAETTGFALGAGVGPGFGTTEGSDMSGDQRKKTRGKRCKSLLSISTARAHNHPRLTMKVVSCVCVLKGRDRSRSLRGNWYPWP